MNVSALNLHVEAREPVRAEAHGSSRWIEIGPAGIFPPRNLTEADEFLAALIGAANDLRSQVTKEMYS